MVPASVLIAAAATFALVSAPAPAPVPATAGSVAPGTHPLAAPVSVPGPAAGELAGPSWEWPLLPRPEVLRGFDVGPQFFSAGHRGVDLAGRPGSVVRAPAPGVVRFAGVVAGRPVLSITHDGGLVSSVEPVTSALRPGERVVAGAAVGTLSALPGHCSPASCLHWGVRSGEVYLDPLQFVRDRPRPVILKPLAGLT